MKNWDHFEYRIAEHYLPAMVNGDYSGMTEGEIVDYREFERVAKGAALADGFTVGHWADVEGSGDDWGRCDVTGLLAMRCTVRLMVYKKVAPA